MGLVEKCFKEGEKTCVLSGDHGNAIMTLAALKRAYPKKRIGIVWVDAHADLHNVYTSPSGNLHGMSLGVFYNHRAPVFLKSKEKNSLWEKLVGLWGGEKGEEAFLLKDLVYVGLRSLEKEEKGFIDGHGVSVSRLKR